MAFTSKNEAIDEGQKLLAITPSDEGFLHSQDFTFAVDDALEKISRDRPLKKSKDRVGNDEFRIQLPTDWKRDISLMEQVEFPVDERPRKFIERNSWEVVRQDESVNIANVSVDATQVTCSTIAEAGLFKKNDIVKIIKNTSEEYNWVSADGNATTGVIALKNSVVSAFTTPALQKVDHLLLHEHTPDSNDVLRMYYTQPYAITDITDEFIRALSNLVAYFIALWISNRYKKLNESYLDGDVADYGNMHQRWKEAADDRLKIYNDALGITEQGRKKAASVAVDLDITPSWGGSWVTHRRNR